jgi:hypothetical protein
MQKILSLTTSDFENGFSSGAQQVKLGLFYAGDKLNPFITEGGLRWTQDPVQIGVGVVEGTPQSFAVNGSDMYSNDASGNIYKIANVFSSPVVTKTKTGLTNTYGLEVLQTKNSLKYLYYFQKTQVGRMKLSDSTYTDSWKSIGATYQADVNPTLRIDDEIYFGSGSYVSKVKDNGSTDTELYEGVLDLPTDYIITSLSTDGYYLIIAASKSIGATLDYNETRIYFWDYRNNPTSWDRSYQIQDPQIRSMKTINGVTYAVGQYGLYALAFSKEPERIRDDIKQTIGYGNMSRIKEAISFGYNDSVITYGKLKPGSPTAVFKPYSTNENITALDTYSSNIYGIFGTDGNKIFRQELFNNPTDYNGAQFITGRINLKDTYQIDRIDVIFASPINSGDSMSVALQTNTFTTNFNNISYTDYGSVSRAKTLPSPVGDSVSDAIALQISNAYGNFIIKQIDIYGEKIER